MKLICRSIVLFLIGALTAQVSAEPIRYAAWKVQGVWVDCVIVDLKDSGVQLRPVLAETQQTASASTLVQRAGHPTAAITGTFFDPATGTIIGNLIADGRMITEGHVGSVLLVYDDGRAEIVSMDGKMGRHWDWSGVRFGVSAGPTLVRDRNLVISPRAEGFRDRGLWGPRKRAALGVTADSKLLLLTTRGTASLHTLGRIFQDLNCVDAVNLDGGSSTALHYKGRWLAKPGRSLTNMIGVYVNKDTPDMSARLGNQYEKAYHHFLAAERLAQKGEFVKAHSNYRKALAMAPDRANYWEALGKLLAGKDSTEAAQAYIKAANLYQERSQTDQAKSCADEARRLDPVSTQLLPELPKNS